MTYLPKAFLQSFAFVKEPADYAYLLSVLTDMDQLRKDEKEAMAAFQEYSLMKRLQCQLVTHSNVDTWATFEKTYPTYSSWVD